ncbi:MAG: dTDP-4-dehydrorhamnose 3,5-epimerase [Cyclobacteriaceae bacterium]|nr:dTDP-4-dehydrorhamnose 3,5-epimerase [Cyclobacteriaceae bacterium]
MEFIKTGFEGLIEIIPKVFHDSRGYFFETYRKDLFQKEGITTEFIQSNQSKSKANVIRGLHLQFPPYAQAKLVRVITGAVLDIVVDLRKNSKTFGQHYKCLLTEEKNNMLYVPEGFAHGFSAIKDSVFHYMVNNVYNKESEYGILWNDSTLNIDWEIENPLVSDKDKNLHNFEEFKIINSFF